MRTELFELQNNLEMGLITENEFRSLSLDIINRQASDKYIEDIVSFLIEN